MRLLTLPLIGVVGGALLLQGARGRGWWLEACRELVGAPRWLARAAFLAMGLTTVPVAVLWAVGLVEP